MEIKINVPINDYQRPSNVREEVVQLICDSFLQGDTYKATCTNHWGADYCVDTEGIRAAGMPSAQPQHGDEPGAAAGQVLGL